MENPIVEKILKDGLNSVNLSMLDENQRRSILADVGERLFKQNRFNEAVDVMSKAGEFEKLSAMGESFMMQGKTELATLCFIPTKDKEKLNSVALKCIQMKNYKLAAKAYEACGNSQMADFINNNF